MKINNDDYEIMKGKIAEYLAQMQVAYDENKALISVFEQSLTNDKPELVGFDYYAAIKFVRTWDIIQSDVLNQSQKNLLFCYNLCDCDLETTLNTFNGKGKSYKNKASLAVLICNIRKIIKKEYNRRYGNS